MFEICGLSFSRSQPPGYEDVLNAAEQLIEQGRIEGLEKRLESLRTAIATILWVRGVRLTEVGGARLAECAVFGVLEAWIGRAAAASAEADVFSG